MKNKLEWKLNPFLSRVGLTFLYVVLLSNAVWAWGRTGHRLIARIAKENLSQSAKSKIEILLRGKSMEDVALWADMIKKYRPETAPWHYVNFTKSEMSNNFKFEVERDNIVTELSKLTNQLKNNKLPFKKRSEALKYIIHFVGDIHQPMHCSPVGDRGGNEIAVSYFSRDTNLHKVWDSGLIDMMMGREDEKLSIIKKKWGAIVKVKADDLNFLEWAKESNIISRRSSYKIPLNHKLGSLYWKKNINICTKQIYLAGIRLAALLNSIFNEK